MRTSIELRSENEISCGNCVGACCQNMKMVLSGAERSRLEDAGSKLVELLPVDGPNGTFDESSSWSDYTADYEELAEDANDKRSRTAIALLAGTTARMKPGEGYYGLVGRCGNLTEDNECGDYENRPQVCVDYPEGTLGCVVLLATVEDRMAMSEGLD